MQNPLPIEKAWRDSKGHIQFKVSCGHSNTTRLWAVNVWVRAEAVVAGRSSLRYALHARIPLDKYPGAEEKDRLISGVRNLFTLKLDSLGIRYVERTFTPKEVL
jgi:hypothetical protein